MAGAAAGGGDWKLAVAAFTVLIGIFGVLTFLVLRSSLSQAEEEEERPARGGQRRRGASSSAADADEEEEEEEEDEAPEGDRAARRNAKKEKKKQERRELVQADREARHHQDTSKSDKQRKYEQKQLEKEAERLKKEKQEEAERMKKERQEEKVRLEKERKEQVEYEKWKKAFTVEEEGFAESNEHDQSNSIVEYVKMRKVVLLEDLAVEFRMRMSAAVDRLEQLEKSGRLNGIFDNSGKYVYVTGEEVSAVGDWLRKKGRTNRAELMAACNDMIKLDPAAEDAAKLDLEVKAAVELLEEGVGGAKGD